MKWAEIEYESMVRRSVERDGAKGLVENDLHQTCISQNVPGTDDADSNGLYLSRRLLKKGCCVVGINNMNGDYGL